MSDENAKPEGVKYKAKTMALGVFLSAILAIVQPWEGFEERPYIDIAGILTVCYGQTGAAARLDKVWTEQECAELLGAELRVKWSELQRCIAPNVELYPHEAAAILSWAYNVGTPAACGSTLIRKLNAGAPSLEWCAELSKWVYAKKAGVSVKVQGLVNRRADERAICEGKRNVQKQSASVFGRHAVDAVRLVYVHGIRWKVAASGIDRVDLPYRDFFTAGTHGLRGTWVASVDSRRKRNARQARRIRLPRAAA